MHWWSTNRHLDRAGIGRYRMSKQMGQERALDTLTARKSDRKPYVDIGLAPGSEYLLKFRSRHFAQRYIARGEVWVSAQGGTVYGWGIPLRENHPELTPVSCSVLSTVLHPYHWWRSNISATTKRTY